MEISVTKVIGKSKVTFVADKEKQIDALAEAAFYASTPDICGLCEGTDLELFSNRAEGYTFVKIRCLNPECKATSQCGQYKDGSGCFWKKFERYVPSAEGQPAKEGKPTSGQEDEDIFK